ncbi:hypothetical protein [Bacillus thuringiensis]|uniref:hypothetical protein n=1 Tax=Bacillus thuringiensis TaxID=1428 RepID=UPI000BFE99E8|nr:hypothetical protein [Bacillus thuringiensis]PGT90102.1 hypothetical protein COD17_10150 [Bacillus thuringiensis]
MSDSLQVFAFGDITIEEVAGEVIQSYEDIIYMGENMTPFTFNKNEFTLPTGNEDNEREEKLCQLFEQGNSVVLCADYENTMRGLVRRLIRNVTAEHEKHLVVVCGLREELWGIILPALQEQKIEPSDCQWLITINANSNAKVLNGTEEYIEIDMTDLASPVLPYLGYIGEMNNKGLLGLYPINGSKEELEKEMKHTEGRGGQVIALREKVKMETKDGYLTEMPRIVGQLPFGNIYANGVIEITNQEIVKKMAKDCVKKNGHLVLVGHSADALEKWLLELTPTSNGLHTLVGEMDNLATFYGRHEDVPYVPCGLQGLTDGDLLNAVNPVKDTSEYLSGVHLKEKQAWELFGLYGEKIVADVEKEISGIVTMDSDTHKSMLDSVVANRTNENPTTEFIGLVESLTLVVKDDGTFEAVVPPISVIDDMMQELGLK